MIKYTRSIEPFIKKRLFEPGKIIVLYGPRQTGKTTLSKKLLRDYQSERGYFNCEEILPRDILMSHDPKLMANFFEGHKVIVLDEAQSVPDIGKALKILIDAYPGMNIIATGSSSFELANKLNEPLTGRHYEFFLPPISFEEISGTLDNAEILSTVGVRMIYGCYPEILSSANNDDARMKLETLASSYLYRDVLQMNHIKNPETLSKILRALAHQVGGGVSYNEIAKAVQIDRKTVMSYVDLLEQAFIIFRLSPLTKNPRDEIKRQSKIYFYDNGIINALTQNFAGVETGRNVGGLWENLMISERRKMKLAHGAYRNVYYWRTHTGQEVDLIEEYDGKYHPYEFKWQKTQPAKGAAAFERNYDDAEAISVINRYNFLDFVTARGLE